MAFKTYKFRGKPYHIRCTDNWPPSHPGRGCPHPSWYCFEDEAEVRDTMWQIEPGDCVFDIGAAFGSYTLPALAVGAAHVLAWSPQGVVGDVDSEADYMKDSLALNHWENKCEIFRFGLYNRDGWIDTQTQEFYETRPEPCSPEVIQVTRLDTWMADRVASYRQSFKNFWFKLDVEGAEVSVIQGALKTIEALRPHFLVENHIFKKASIEQEVRSLLGGLGYVEAGTVPYNSVSHSLYHPKELVPAPASSSRYIAETYVNHHHWGKSAIRWWAHPQILVGGTLYDAQDWQHLVRDFGVSACVSVESEHADTDKVPAEILIEVGEPNDGKPRTRAGFFRMFDFVSSVLRKNPNAKFYIHCRMGNSRSPAYAYALLRIFFKLSVSEALESLRRREDGFKYGDHHIQQLYIENAEEAALLWKPDNRIAESYANHHYWGHICKRWWAHPQILVGGSIYDDKDWQHLARDFGMRACVSVESEHSDVGKVPPELLLYVPAPDDGSPRSSESFLKTFDFVAEVLRKDPLAKIHVHCQMGGSRSPAQAYAIMRANFGMSAEDALANLKREDGFQYGGHEFHKAYMRDAEQALVLWKPGG